LIYEISSERIHSLPPEKIIFYFSFEEEVFVGFVFLQKKTAVRRSKNKDKF